MKKPRTEDRHAAESAILVRMSAADRDQIAQAVAILNERVRADGGRYYMGSFMLQAALAKAKEVVGGRTTHVTKPRP